MIRQDSQEILFKLVYWGAPFAGKSTNMAYLYERVPPCPARKDNEVARPPGIDPTLCFDFLPRVPPIDDRVCRVHVYNAYSTYQQFRDLLLVAVDALVFVCDSRAVRADANRAALEALEQTLATNQLSLARLPHVIQYNKRDLDDILPVASLRSELNAHGAPDFEAIATRGVNVVQCLYATVSLMLHEHVPR